MGFLSDIFDPGRKERRAARRFAEQAPPTSGTVTGPGGITSGFNVGPEGAVSLSGDLGSFDPFLSAFQGVAGRSLADFGSFDEFLGGAGADALGDLGSVGGDRLAAFQEVLGSALPTATADPFSLGESVRTALQPQLDRAQNRLRNQTFDRLFQSGRSAVSGAASPILEDLSNTFAEQNVNLGVRSLELGRGLRNDALSQIFQASGAAGGIEAANANRALSRFGTSSNLIQNVLAARSQQLGIGQTALSGATGLAQLPLAFQNPLQAFQGLVTNSRLGQASTLSQLASQARSPFLEALTAAGTFASNVGLGFGGGGGGG